MWWECVGFVVVGYWGGGVGGPFGEGYYGWVEAEGFQLVVS